MSLKEGTQMPLNEVTQMSLRRKGHRCHLEGRDTDVIEKEGTQMSLKEGTQMSLRRKGHRCH